jgi:hypothetical protein
LLLSDFDAEGLHPFDDQILILSCALAFRLAASGLSPTDRAWHFRNTACTMADAVRMKADE